MTRSITSAWNVWRATMNNSLMEVVHALAITLTLLLETAKNVTTVVQPALHHSEQEERVDLHFKTSPVGVIPTHTSQ